MKKTRQVGNGEGSLFLNKKLNRWQYSYYNTKSKRETITQKKSESLKEFKQRVTKIKNDINQGTYIEKNNETFLSILEQHIEQKHIDGITSDRSYKRNLDTLEEIKKCCDFVGKPIQKITIKDVENSKINMKTYSNSVIGKMWGFIEKTFQIATARRMIPFNIMQDENLKKPISEKPNKKVDSLTIEEEEKLINILNTQERNHKYRNIILLQLYTGMRIGEVLALSKDCIDLKNKTITVYRTLTKDLSEKVIMGKHTKTYVRLTGVDKGKRTFPMSDKVFQLIKDILSQKNTNIQGLLFWDYAKNTYVTGGEINSYLKRISKKYDIVKGSIHSHRLRHTFITRCVEKGMNYEALQKIVGHTKGSNITSEVYTTVSQEFIKKELEKII